MLATTCIVNVTRKSPLANAPRFHGAQASPILIVAWHSGGAPIRLMCDCTEVSSGCAAHVNANVMRSDIILLIYAVSGSCVTA